MTLKASNNIPEKVSKCLELALLLEVSAYPKPGNVHRTAEFQETRYEHFLASAVALTSHFSCAADRGMQVFNGKITLNQISIGETIKNAVTDVNVWQHGGNTVLGATILLVPMAAAAGFTLSKGKSFSVDDLRTSLRLVVESATSLDAVRVYDAIAMAHPGGLGKSPQLDLKDEKSKRKIVDEDISLLDVFRISSSWDSISAEWVSDYHITFDIGYPFFMQTIKTTGDVNIATVHTYLKILSEIPDTLIIRKAGMAKARQVSLSAKQILEAGGLTTAEGKRRLFLVDRKLRKDSHHRFNPGATADITSAVLAVAILSGYRP